MEPKSVQPVFIAPNTKEAELVEQLLDREGIPFELTPEPHLQSSSAVCYQGLLFEVPAGQAEYCRTKLREAGLGRGVVKSEEVRVKRQAGSSGYDLHIRRADSEIRSASEWRHNGLVQARVLRSPDPANGRDREEDRAQQDDTPHSNGG